MEQVAAEFGVSFLSYSMTHYTRQSAIGLPFIETKDAVAKNILCPNTLGNIILSMPK